MNPTDPKEHPQPRDLGSSHPRIDDHTPIFGPMEALIADLDKLRDLGSVPPNWAGRQLDSWKDNRELYLELNLGTVMDSYFDVSVLGGKVFITIHM